MRDGKIITDALQRSRDDSTIRGYRKMLREDPDRAKRVGEEIIKNTYRTLMTRRTKGCFIWSEDAETNEYFRGSRALGS